MNDKKELRKYFAEIRKSAQNQEKDLRIAEKLLAEEKIVNADTILIFASFSSEPDTWEMAERLLSQNKCLAYPKCEKDGIMIFHVVNSTDALKNGAYGICEPDSSLPSPVITDKTVCIVPGLAFTENGGRLGYGGGYYDRFLSANPNIYKIALAYEAVITDHLNTAEHDIAMDAIVTEERTVLCNAR